MSSQDIARQYVVIATTTMIAFADSVEMYLPGIITQPVACELGLSPRQEVVLGISLYASLFTCSLFITTGIRILGVRHLIMFALYWGCVFTVACALVPNFTTLVLSRVMLGGTIVLLQSAISLYIRGNVATSTLCRTAFSLVCLASSTGGAWVGLLAYIGLDRLGWRFFVMLTSLPFYIIPLLVFHIYLHDNETKGRNYEAVSCQDNQNSTLSKECSTSSEGGQISFNTETKKWTHISIATIGLIQVLRTCFTVGAIHLVPSILKDFNLRKTLILVSLSSGLNTSCGEIHGVQFLWFTLLFGGCHGGGVVLAMVTQSRVPVFTFLISISTCFTLAMVTMATYSDNILVLMPGLGFIQVFAITLAVFLYAIQFDKTVFPHQYMPLCSCIFYSSWYLGTLLGNILAISLPYKTILTISPILAVTMTGLLPVLKLVLPQPVILSMK